MRQFFLGYILLFILSAACSISPFSRNSESDSKSTSTDGRSTENNCSEKISKIMKIFEESIQPLRVCNLDTECQSAVSGLYYNCSDSRCYPGCSLVVSSKSKFDEVLKSVSYPALSEDLYKAGCTQSSPENCLPPQMKCVVGICR